MDGKTEQHIQKLIGGLVEEIREHVSNPEKKSSTLSSLNDTYYDKKYLPCRELIGNTLSDCNYSEYAFIMLQVLQKKRYACSNMFNALSNTWKTSKYVMNIIWNYSNASREFACDLAKANIIMLMCENLKMFPPESIKKSDNEYWITIATLAIMTNLARIDQIRYKFGEYGSFELVMKFKNYDDDYIKVLSLITLAYISNVPQSQTMTNDKEVIKTIIHWMNLSIGRDKTHRIKEGFTADELADALSQLAVDGYAENIIMDRLAPKALKRMLKKSAPIEYRISAAKCLSNLAFHTKAKDYILKENRELVSMLEEMEKGQSNADLLKHVNDALCNFRDRGEESIALKTEKAKPRHVFVNYYTGDADKVNKIWNNLEIEGYNVLFDPDNTIEKVVQGDPLEALAESLARATIVVMCVSEGFRSNARARLIANYTVRFYKDKRVIVIYLQWPYDAEGWLGLILCGPCKELKFDFMGSDEIDFSRGMETFLRELTEIEGNTEENSHFPSLNKVSKITTSSVACQTISPVLKADITESYSKMKKRHVEMWLITNGLPECAENFKEIDGSKLWELKCMNTIAPHFLALTLKDHFEMDEIQISKFIDAITDLN
ncbi:hypothetical protein SNE40_003361 [Patella caerulea]|uniref:TIR domain-containing protein n=1 Tax=Patella caerulea TaxID=87958 RepID=A0AAN8KB22_PATCE